MTLEGPLWVVALQTVLILAGLALAVWLIVTAARS